MKKTSTFLYSPHINFTVPLPENDQTGIQGVKSSTHYSPFSQISSCVRINEPAPFNSNLKTSYLVPFIPILLNASTFLHERVKYNYPTGLQLIQVICAPFFKRGLCLHSALMSHKSMGLTFNPKSSLLNLI